MDNFEAQRQISAAFREGVREGRTQLIREIDDIVAKYDWQSDHLYAFSELLKELGVESKGSLNNAPKEMFYSNINFDEESYKTMEKVEMNND
jgi:hypothetical protein